MAGGLTFADGQVAAVRSEMNRLENQIVSYRAQIEGLTAQLANALDENKRLMSDLSKLMHAAAHPMPIPHQERQDGDMVE